MEITFAVALLMAMLLLSFGSVTLSAKPADTKESPQFSMAQAADLQFTEDPVFITVEQGGSNTGIVRVHNYGDAIGSANISFAGLEPDGITVELSTTDIIDLHPGDFQDVIAIVSAIADLWPLGPRRLDLELVNLTTGFGFDDMHLEINLVAPSTTTPPPGILGIPVETIILSVFGTLLVIIIIIWLKRR